MSSKARRAMRERAVVAAGGLSGGTSLTIALSGRERICETARVLWAGVVDGSLYSQCPVAYGGTRDCAAAGSYTRPHGTVGDLNQTRNALEHGA